MIDMIPDSELINAQLVKVSAELTVTVVCRAFGMIEACFTIGNIGTSSMVYCSRDLKGKRAKGLLWIFN